MTAGRSDRGPVRIRRRGRHTTPSQVEKVAQQAGKAAPAVAIAGALVAAPAAPQALAAAGKPATATTLSHAAATADKTVNTSGIAGQAVGAAGAAGGADKALGAVAQQATATLDSFETRSVTVTGASAARHAAPAQGTYYSVRGGDTLSKIAGSFYHNPGDWRYLYHENAKTVSDPNLIYTGERLLVPATVPAHYTLSDYVPKHAVAVAQPAAATVSQASQSAAHTAVASAEAAGRPVAQSAEQGGVFSCSGLEQLWEQAGGTPADALMAAEIAMAESGGNPNAISPTDDFGLWQINGSNGALATLNPFQNAKSAVTLSGDGTNWNPWTTYRTGAYSGKC